METQIFIEKIKRLKQWSQGKPQMPISAEFQITNKCNLNCLSCWQYNKKKEERNELSYNQWKNILDQAIDLRIKEIYIGGGGEPFCRSNILIKIISEVKKQGIYGELTTNGTFFDFDIIKEIVKSEWDNIQISIDGPNEELQDYLRNSKGVFKKNVEFLRLFNYWKKKLHKSKPTISFHTVISNKNYKNLKEITKLASKYNCYAVFFQKLVIQNEYCNNLDLHENQENELKKILKQASNLSEKLKIQTNVNSILKNNKNDIIIKKPKRWLIWKYPFYDTFCFEPFTHISIKSNGLVQTCCNPLQEYESIDTNNLREIWYGKKYNSLRRRMIRQNPPNVCCTHPTKRNEQNRLRELLLAEKK